MVILLVESLALAWQDDVRPKGRCLAIREPVKILTLLPIRREVWWGKWTAR
jgi:hypothetical protein